jgi:hypothetical protein
MLRCLILVSVAFTHALVDFPQLPALVAHNTYNSTSCAHRCCRKAVVTKDPGSEAACATDWTACAQLDSSSTLAACNYTSGTWARCSVWVPCDPNPRIDFGVSLGVLLLVSAAPAYLLYSHSDRLVWSYPIFAQITWEVLSKVLCGWTLFYASDFDRWYASTEVPARFAVTLACLETCVGDACSFCSLDSNDWVYIQHIALFVKTRAYMVWVAWLLMYALLLLSIDNRWFKTAYWWYGLYAVLAQTAFFVTDSIFLSDLLNKKSLDALFVYATNFPVMPTVATLLAFDVLSAAIAGLVWWWVVYSSDQYTPLVTTEPTKAMFHAVSIRRG